MIKESERDISILVSEDTTLKECIVQKCVATVP